MPFLQVGNKRLIQSVGQKGSIIRRNVVIMGLKIQQTFPSVSFKQWSIGLLNRSIEQIQNKDKQFLMYFVCLKIFYTFSPHQLIGVQKNKIIFLSKDKQLQTFSVMTNNNQGDLSLLDLTEQIQIKDTISIQINSQYLNHNFHILKQCLQKIQELNSGLVDEKNASHQLSQQVSKLSQQISDNSRLILQQDSKIKQLQNNIGDGFMKKLYDIESKTKNTLDFDETLDRLQKLGIFMTTQQFEQEKTFFSSLQEQFEKVKTQLDRYVEKNEFSFYQGKISLELNDLRKQIDSISSINTVMKGEVERINEKCNKASAEVEENNLMLKEINFAEMQEKIKKFRDQTDHKLGEFLIKLKKKCALNDLAQLEKNMVQRLDKFLLLNQKGKASLDETKNALVYLERRVNQLQQIILSKQDQEQNDALFSSKKIHCASCTKDLGKFQGRLGQFRPWAVFPCKELQPQKTGGYGYVNYVDKLQYRKGSALDDSSLQRLNKTYYSKNPENQKSPQKLNTTRTTNFMSNYGEEARNLLSLKDEYFKEVNSQKKAGKYFRVKQKQKNKPSTAIDLVVKEREENL